MPGVFTVATSAADGSDFKLLDTFALTAEHRYSYTGTGSCKAASWSMDLPRYFEDPALKPGRRVRIYEGLECVWGGILAPAKRGEPWEFTAVGGYILADNFMSISMQVTPDGETITVPCVLWEKAVFFAQGRGLPWQRRTDDNLFSDDWSGAYAAAGMELEPGPLPGLLTLGELLDTIALMRGDGYDWFVDENLMIDWKAPDTSPTFTVFDADGVGGRSISTYVTQVFAKFIDEADGLIYVQAGDADTKLADEWGVVEKPIDMTELGPIDTTSLEPAAFATNAREAAPPHLGFNGSLTFHRKQTLGFGSSTPYPISTAKAGQMTALRGVQVDLESGDLKPFQSVLLPFVDCEFNSVEDTLTIQPPGTQPNDVESALQKAFDAAKEYFLPRSKSSRGSAAF